MRILIVAETKAIREAMVEASNGQWIPARQDAEDLIEFAGRNCYQSWDRPSPATAAADDYVKHIMEVGHFSVLEHASVTLYVDGVSRSLLAEFTRHRHLSYSIQSQRYVDESAAGMIESPDVENLPADIAEDVRAILSDAEEDARDHYSRLLTALGRAEDWGKKRIRGLARSVMPQMTETKIVVTGNHRGWHDFLETRLGDGVEIEIKEMARQIADILFDRYPAIYRDI